MSIPISTEDVTRLTQSITVKVFLVAVLSIALFVPLVMTMALLHERSERRDAVVTEVADSWGRAQTVGGIALSVPYEVVSPATPTMVATRTTGRATVLPSTLRVEIVLTPETRRRSIFEAIVYRAAVVAAGTFRVPDAAALGLGNATLFWDRASLAVGVTDLGGLSNLQQATWNGQPMAFEPAADPAPFSSAVRAPVVVTQAADMPFRIETTLAGSGQISVLPSGGDTTVTMGAPWPSPGFTGALLPTSHQITEAGFQAEWHSTFLSRPFPQRWTDASITAPALTTALSEGTFTVDLVTPVDVYQQTERAMKYGFLFIVFTLGLFLVWEVTSSQRLHAVQYLFVGLAIVVFYLLLLSLSEQIAFGSAYLIAAVATIALVTTYSRAILRSGAAVWSVGAALSVLYGLMFVLLGLEDLALLVGSILVFVALALAMFLTRRVNWFASREMASS